MILVFDGNTGHHSASVDRPVKKDKHRLGYDSTWLTDYPWHVPVYENDEDDESTVIGVLCLLCKQHKVKQRNKSETWTEKPCTLLRKDMLHRRLQIGSTSTSSDSS